MGYREDVQRYANATTEMASSRRAFEQEYRFKQLRFVILLAYYTSNVATGEREVGLSIKVRHEDFLPIDLDRLDAITLRALSLLRFQVERYQQGHRPSLPTQGEFDAIIDFTT